MTEQTIGDYWTCPNCKNSYPAGNAHTCGLWQNQTFTYSTFPNLSDSANLARIADALEEIVKILQAKG